MSDPLVRAERLGYSYKSTDSKQLSQVSFDIRAGERVAIMGATGAGKTTLAMMFNGLVPHHHPGDLFGTLHVNGLATHEAEMSDLVRTVGLVMQDPEAQLTARRAVDDAAVGPANLGLPRDEVWERARAALQHVGLAELEDRDTSQMSGGQQQRLAIAGILAMAPEILVLDEPTSELDPAGTREVYQIIEDQCATGRTVVLIDHDSDKVAGWADKLAVLVDGILEYFGPPGDFFSDADRVRRAGLRQPAEFEILDVAAEVGLIDPLMPLKPGATHEDRFAELRHQLATADVVTPPQPLSPRSEVKSEGATNEPPAIETHGLSHQYPSGVLALDGVDVRIGKGEFVALLGKNGAGKTTFARHLVNLLHPTSGRVLVNGRDTAGRKVHELASEVGYVFQNPDHQIFATSVFDEVAFGLRNFGVGEDETRSRVHEVLARVHIEDAIDKHPFTLGRGERQRVAVASVLALRPGILVIDEPTTGQDWRGAVAMLELVRELNEEGTTIIMITHDMLLASRYAERAIVFSAAQVALDAPVTELFGDADRIPGLNLEVPYLTDLASGLGLGTVRNREELRAALERTSRAS